MNCNTSDGKTEAPAPGPALLRIFYSAAGSFLVLSAYLKIAFKTFTFSLKALIIIYSFTTNKGVIV